jgi:hypothetical protein
VHLVVDTDSIARTQKGTIWGRTWFESGLTCFPGRGWSDLVPAFIRAWLESLLEISDGRRSTATVFFMDGPYSIEISLTGKGLNEARFYGDYEGNRLQLSTTSESQLVLRDAIEAGERVMSVYKAKSWFDEDQAAIEFAIERCRSHL